MQNNKKYHREWFDKHQSANKSKKGGLSHGFEYAVQPDGSCLAETMWQDRRKSSTKGYTFVPRASGTSASSRLYQSAPSLRDIESMALEARRRYQDNRKLPDMPEVVVSDETPPLHSVDGAPFLSPQRRIRNRHNAVFGQHLPNALNAHGCSTKVFGKQVAEQEEQMIRRNAMSEKENKEPSPLPMEPIDVDMEEDDAFLADVDVDELVAQRSAKKQQDFHYKTPEQHGFDYGVESGYNSAANPAFPKNGGLPQDRYGAATYEGRSSVDSFPVRDSIGSVTSFHASDTSATTGFSTAASMAQHDDSVPLCPGHNLPCRSLVSTTAMNNGRQFYKCSLPEGEQCDFFAWADGQEGNWNSFENGDSSASAGSLLDVNAENRRKFGHSSFRPGQKEVIGNAMQGRDVFVLMPTGGGKSLCYQLPAWCCPGLAVVISPLLSLIQDQVQSLTKLGVESVFLCSAQDYETEQKDITRRLFQTTAHGGVKLLYITPEKLRHSGVIKNVLKSLYDKGLLSRFVVDEAHCLRYVGRTLMTFLVEVGCLSSCYQK